MARPLLLLALLCSQAVCLAGPGVVRCRDRAGRLRLEWAGSACTQCRLVEVSACGCCHRSDDDAPPPAAVPGCDCEHQPLCDAQPPATGAAPPAPDGFAPPTAAHPFAPSDAPPVRHRPPPDRLASAHLALLAGGLRC